MDHPIQTGSIAAPLLSWFRRPRKKSGSNDLSPLGAAIISAAGDVRPENQDRAVVARFIQTADPTEAFTVMVVCDGMGGMVDGGRCAEIAVSAFLDSLVRHAVGTPSENLRRAALEANQAVFRTYRGRGGTTLTAVLFTAANTSAVSVGDTRLFEISESKVISQVSVDDTIAGELRRIHGSAGAPQDLEAFSNRLAQYVGMGDELEPRMYPLHIRRNWYLICTDGVQSIPEDTIQKVVASTDTVSSLVNRLIHLSFWCGGQDNASAICFGGYADKSRLQEQQNGCPRLQIWDAFGAIEILFFASPLQGKETGVGTTAVTEEHGARKRGHWTKPPASPWKKPDAAKSKKVKRTETKGKKAKSATDASKSGPPKQFEMEIVESRSLDTSNDPGRTDDTEKK